MNELLQRIWNFLISAQPGESLAAAEWPPQFAQSNYVKLGLGLLLAFMIWLTIRNYRREGENPTKVKGFLAAIRIATLVMLFLIAMKPALVWHKTRTLYSDVVVLFDDSLSMAYDEDFYDQAALDELSALLEIQPEQLKKMSRRDIMLRVLDTPDSVLAQLADNHTLRLLAFSEADSTGAGYVRTIGEMSLVTSGAEQDERSEEQLQAERKEIAEQISESLGKLSASGFETKYPVALAGALEKIRGRRCSGIVVIGDGQNTRDVSSPSIKDIKRQADTAGVPIFTVLVGSSSRPAAARVTSLRANPRVLRGNEMKFAATVGYTNLEMDRVVNVQLQRRPQGSKSEQDWSTVAMSPRPITLRRPSLNEQNETIFVDVSIPYEPSEVGDYEFRAVLTPKVEKSKTQADDSIAQVTVVDERIRILLVSGDSGWEMQRLKDFFLRQPQLYQLSVWQQNSDKQLSQAASTGMKLDKLPRTLEELIGSPDWKAPDDPDRASEIQEVDGKTLYPGYNVVILYDPEPTEGGFDGQFIELLEQFVDPHGGGLVYLASNKNTEEIIKNPQFDPLLNLLPVELVHDTAAEVALISERRAKPWPVRPTVYGTDHPILMIGQTPEMNQQIWSELPGIYWSHTVAQIKLGARVLAEHGNPTRMTMDKQREPVIAFQRYGSGRVLYIGSDETWRWKIVENGDYYRDFWANTVRYLSTLKPRLVDIYLAEGKEKYNVGSEIKIRTRAYTETYQPVESETFTVYVIDLANPDAEKEVVLTGDKLAGEPGRFSGTVTLADEGNYEITALADKDQRADRVAARRIAVTVPEDEKKHPEADPTQMHRVATGNNFLQIWQVNELGDRIETGRLQIRDEARKELWDTPLALLIVVVLLATEWILRKKYNMA